MLTRLVIWYETGPELRVSLQISLDEEDPSEESWKTVLVLSDIDEIKDTRLEQWEREMK